MAGELERRAYEFVIKGNQVHTSISNKEEHQEELEQVKLSKVAALDEKEVRKWEHREKHLKDLIGDYDEIIHDFYTKVKPIFLAAVEDHCEIDLYARVLVVDKKGESASLLRKANREVIATY